MTIKIKKLRLVSYVFIAILVYVVLYLINPNKPAAWDEAALEILKGLGVTILGVMIVAEIELVITRQLDKLIPWKNAIRKRLIVQLGVQILLVYLTVAFLKLIMPVFFSETLVYKQAIIVGIILSVLITAVFVAESFLAQWKQSIMEANRYEQQAAKAQMEFLKLQIDPHFLFNNFSTLISLIEDDPQLAVEYVEKLSAIYRHALKEQDEHVVPLGEELDFINSYLFLYKIRYQDGLEVRTDIPASIMHKGIATATLQLLVENAIKHNSISKQQPLIIEIFSDADDLIVRNNINHTSKRIVSTGLGLKNVSERYKLLGNRAVFIDKTDGSFTVKIPLLEEYI